MTADDKVTRSLEKLKLQQKQAPVKKSGFFLRDIDDMDFDIKKDSPQQQQTNRADATNSMDNIKIRKIEVMLRRLEDTIEKMSAGTNYLMYYGQMQETEKEFLEATSSLEEYKESLPPQLYNRIMFKREQILKKRKR